MAGGGHQETYLDGAAVNPESIQGVVGLGGAVGVVENDMGDSTAGAFSALLLQMFPSQ